MPRFEKFLIVAILFLLPWQTRFIFSSGRLNDGYWEYGTISLYLLDLLIVLSLLVHIAAARRIDFRFKKITYRYLVAAMLIGLAFFSVFSLVPGLSFYKFGWILVATALIYLLSKTKVRAEDMSLSFILGAAASATLGIWQFISQSTFISKWLGLAGHEASELGTSVIETIAPDGFAERWLRAYGSLDHPNMFGGFCALALIMAVWLWLNRLDRLSHYGRLLLMVSMILLGGGLLFAWSRSAWLAAAIGLFITAVAYWRKETKDRKDFFILILIGLVLAALVMSRYYYIAQPRLTQQSRLEQKSNDERLVGIKEAQALIANHSISGTGLGTYTLASSRELKVDQPSWFYQPVHNVFLLILTETGFLGFSLIIAALVSFIASIYRNSRQARSVIISLSLAVFSLALFDHWLFSLHFGFILSGALLGLVAAFDRTEA